MNDAQRVHPGTRRPRRWPLILLFVLFAAPLIAALILYFNINHFNIGSTSHGEFIKPARALRMAALPLPLATGSLAADFFKGHFTLVYLGAADCNPDCEDALYVTRQVRYAMGQKIELVQRLYLVDGMPQNPAKLLRLHPDLTVADVSNAAGQNFIRQLSPDGRGLPKQGRFIYLVDPHGFYIMRYSVNANPEGLLNDLKHLLGGGGM